MSCSTNGKPPRDKENDRGPDSVANSEVVAAHQAADLGNEGDETTDDVDNAKGFRSLDVVHVLEVHLLLGCLDDEDHLVWRIWLILLRHFKVSLVKCTAVSNVPPLKSSG